MVITLTRPSSVWFDQYNNIFPQCVQCDQSRRVICSCVKDMLIAVAIVVMNVFLDPKVCCMLGNQGLDPQWCCLCECHDLECCRDRPPGTLRKYTHGWHAINGTSSVRSTALNLISDVVVLCHKQFWFIPPLLRHGKRPKNRQSSRGVLWNSSCQIIHLYTFRQESSYPWV